MSKVLVVFYSYTGTGRKVADLLQASFKWPVGEITEAQPRGGSSGTWHCVLDSMFRRSPLIIYKGPDPEAFDAVVLVSPVWAYRLAGPMRTFMRLKHQSIRDFAVITVMGGSGAPNAVAELTKIAGRTPLLDVAFKTAEVNDGSLLGRLQAFGNAVVEAEKLGGASARQSLTPEAA